MRQQQGWIVWADENETEFHVIPNFGKAHTLGDDCWCAPKVEAEGANLMIVHNLEN